MKYQWLWIAALIAGTVYVLHRHNNQPEYKSINGKIFGTIYKITYQHNDDLKPEVEKELKRFDASLSPFNENSIITKVNRNEEVKTDMFFQQVFRRSMEISAETGGAFDITTAPLVNAWNFGFKKEVFPDEAMIDSLLQIIGYEKIALEGDAVVKQDPRIMLNCSAVAKGYAADVIGRLLAGKNIKNYMVEIGGEIVTKGMNPKNELWRIGINEPTDDFLSQKLYTTLKLNDAALATSGNYRNYYYKDGKKYAHTIDPSTGYPVEHNLLSTTVIACDCMTADALATAFMVMGVEKAKAFAEARSDIAVYLIYKDEKGELTDYYTENMEEYLDDITSIFDL